MKNLFEEAVKRAAAVALEEQADTLVCTDDLSIAGRADIWPLRRAYNVVCECFDNFVVRVYVGRFGRMRGIPTKATVYMDE